VPGRSGAAYAGWLAARNEAFRAGITVATLDPFHGYKNAIDDQQAEAVEIRAGESSVEHVEVFQVDGVGTSIIGRPRPLPGTDAPTPATSIGKPRYYSCQVDYLPSLAEHLGEG
jgi:hypothetical protein